MSGVYDFSGGFNAINNAINGLDTTLRERSKQRAMAGIGEQVARGDYNGAAQKLFNMGDLASGLKLADMGRSVQQQTEANRAFSDLSQPATRTAPVNIGSPNEVEDRFMRGARESGLTNPMGQAVVAAYGRAESGFAPGNVNRSWSDPSQSGKAGTSGGIMSWRNERLDRMYKFAEARGEQRGNISPETQAAFLVAENPQLLQQLNNARSPEEANRIMANAWRFAGYNQAGGENARRLALTQQYAQRNGAMQQADIPAEGATPARFNQANNQGRIMQLQRVLAMPGITDGQRQIVKTELEQLVKMSDPLYQAQLARAQQNEMPADVRSLQWRAQELGLQPGTQEYRDFISQGGRDTRDPESERRIRALEGRGMPRDQAENAVYGFTQIVTDPIIGSSSVVDRTTGNARPVTLQGGQQPAAAQPTSTLPKLYDLADTVTGAIPAAQEAWTNIAPQFNLPGVDGVVESRQIINAAARDLIRALSINPRFPVGEMKAIEQEINISPSVFTSSESLKQRMRGVDAVLRRRLENESRTAENEKLPVEARRNSLQAMNDISNFLNTLGVPQDDEASSAAASEATPEGTIIVDDSGARFVLRGNKWEPLN